MFHGLCGIILRQTEKRSLGNHFWKAGGEEIVFVAQHLIL